MSGGKAGAPLVIRTGTGGWLSAAAQHSQSLEAWFVHVPGIKVVTAGTPADVRTVLRAAIADESPVLVIESLSLYERQDEVPEVPKEYRLGTADVKRSGSDATVVTWGAMVPRALEAADELAAEGTQVEVVDLLSLRPWDRETVLASVERTNRVVVAHQAHRHGGFGAEVAATIAERAFDSLDAPVSRVGSLDVPVPFSPPLEEYVLPNADRIADAVRGLG